MKPIIAIDSPPRRRYVCVKWEVTWHFLLFRVWAETSKDEYTVHTKNVACSL